MALKQKQRWRLQTSHKAIKQRKRDRTNSLVCPEGSSAEVSVLWNSL